jgi:gliding motility-associated-like protein
MRQPLVVLFVFACFLLKSQQLQWHSSLPLAQGHFDDRVFMEQLGSNTAVVYLARTATSVDPLLTLGVLDDCGQSINNYVLKAPGFSPRRIVNIQRDAGGNLYICGISDSTQPYAKVFILKVNPQHQLVWAKQYTNHTVYPYSFEINQQGELFMLFNTEDNIHGNSLLKVNSAGQLVWAKSFGYSPIWGMGGPTADGGCILTTGSIIFKVSPAGVMEWRTLVSGSHYTTAPVEIDGGYMLFQGYPNSSKKSRVVMLNNDGSFRWASAGFQNFNASSAKKLSNTEVLFMGDGNSAHASAPASRGMACMRINTQGQFTDTRIFHATNERLFGLGIDQLITANGEHYSVERKFINNTESHLVFSRLPENLDSSSCYTVSPFEAPDIFALTHSSQPLVQSKSMNFSIQSINLSILPTGTQALNLLCQKSPMGAPFSLGPDTLLCPGEVLVLKGPANQEYQWSTGQTSRNISVTETGWYSLSTQAGCDTTVYTDSIFVEFYPLLELDIRFNAPVYYVGDTLLAEGFGGPSNQYRWLLDGREVDPGKTHTQLCTRAGVYTLRLVYETIGGCTYTLDRDFEVRLRIPEIPNVFSPNGDNINDVFDVRQDHGVVYSMQIFNRYGTLIAETNNSGWDGYTTLNQAAAEGVYFYLLYWDQNPNPYTGHVTLVR